MIEQKEAQLHLQKGDHNNLIICAIAVDQLNVEAARAVHIGDDQKADKAGANAIGIDCWYVQILRETFILIR